MLGTEYLFFFKDFKNQVKKNLNFEGIVLFLAFLNRRYFIKDIFFFVGKIVLKWSKVFWRREHSP
jgi:hypothetical protein